MKVKSISLKNNNSILAVLKGSIIALVISLLSILAFAFIIKLTGLNDNLIKPINQVIKVLSIFIGCLLAFKKDGEKTLIKGGIIGVLYIILAFVLFSILNGGFDFSAGIFLDILFGLIVGVICAVVCNLFRKK